MEEIGGIERGSNLTVLVSVRNSALMQGFPSRELLLSGEHTKSLAPTIARVINAEILYHSLNGPTGTIAHILLVQHNLNTKQQFLVGLASFVQLYEVPS